MLVVRECAATRSASTCYQKCCERAAHVQQQLPKVLACQSHYYAACNCKVFLRTSPRSHVSAGVHIAECVRVHEVVNQTHCRIIGTKRWKCLRPASAGLSHATIHPAPSGAAVLAFPPNTLANVFNHAGPKHMRSAGALYIMPLMIYQPRAEAHMNPSMPSSTQLYNMWIKCLNSQTNSIAMDRASVTQHWLNPKG
jgi:hypothetical protein